MEQLIQNLIGSNPYRILGVYVGDSIAKETSHRSRISAFSKVGQTAAFALKGDDRLPLLTRSEEMAQKAVQGLSLPIERIKFSLFWYADEKFSWAPALNGAIDALLSQNITDALSHYEYLIQDDYLRNDFVETVTHGIFSIEKDNLANILIDTISEYIGGIELISQGKPSNKAHYLNGIFFERWVRAELNKLTGEYIKEHNDFYVLIDNLKSTTERIISCLNFSASLLGRTDRRYNDCAKHVACLIYEQGQNVLLHIGRWVNLKRALISVKLCRSLIIEVSLYVDNSVERLTLDDESRRKVAETFAIDFASVCLSQQYYIERILKTIKHKELVKTAIWLALIVLFFFLLNN